MHRDLRSIPSRHGASPHVCDVAAAVIGAVATVGGAAIGASAQTKAAKTAANTQMHMYDTTRGDLLPYNQAGQGALPGINNLISGDPATVQAQLEKLPGYQFALTQGLKSVQNGAAARGLGASGAALKGAAGYATGLADNTFGAQFNRLMAVAGLGENAAAQTGNAGSQAANGASAAQIGAGNAMAGFGAAVGNAGNQIGQYFALNKLMGGGGGGGGSSAMFPTASSGGWGSGYSAGGGGFDFSG
jgi:hypothetical protein